VLTRSPDLATLPASTPAAVRSLLRRCLERNPRQRLHDIADARLQLEDAAAAGGAESPPAAAPRRALGRLAALATVAGLLVGLAAGALAVRRFAGPSLPSYERLTFRPGHFVNARFAPDGETLFLAASWDGRPREIVQVRPRSGELPVGLQGVELLSISRAGELAVLLPRLESGNPYWRTGTLAVVSSSGGTPRELADDVINADWAPDGHHLAVVKVGGGRYRLEYPLGTLLYESPTRLSWPRVAPDGEGVAFFAAVGGGWSVVYVDRAGASTVLSADWADWWNLAWSADGEEVWFGASRRGTAASLYAVDRKGTLRALMAAPGTVEIHDVAPDGTVAAALVHNRNHLLGGLASEATGRDLSWLDQAVATALARDGSAILLESWSEREDGGISFLRSLDGAPPLRLGVGTPQDLSRDGRRALAIRGNTVVSMPIGAGAEEVLETKLAPLAAARWMPDGRSALVLGTAEDGRTAAVIASFDGGPARTVSAALELRFGLSVYRGLSPVSPDGGHVAVTLARGVVGLLGLADGELRELPGSGSNDFPIEWSTDGRRLLVYDVRGLPARLEEVDVASGARTLWREVGPLDRVGVHGLSNVLATPDRSAWACTYGQYHSTLYLVRGLR
jgi:hypothetical protein